MMEIHRYDILTGMFGSNYDGSIFNDTYAKQLCDFLNTPLEKGEKIYGYYWCVPVFEART